MVQIESPQAQEKFHPQKFLNSMGWLICLLILLIAFLTVFVTYQSQRKIKQRVVQLEQQWAQRGSETNLLQEKNEEASNKVQEIGFEMKRFKGQITGRLGQMDREHQSIHDTHRQLEVSLKTVINDLEHIKETFSIST